MEAAKRVVDLAARAVDVEKIKLGAGRSSNFQVQSLEANYRNAQLQLLNAEIAYLNAMTQLDLQIGTTMGTWKLSLWNE